MKNTDIKNVFFRNNGASALYCGSDLIWKMGNVDENPKLPTGPNILSGKFTDDSNEEDWVLYVANSYYRTSIADKVNKETKEFYLEAEQSSLLDTLFGGTSNRRSKIERVYCIPDWIYFKYPKQPLASAFNSASNLEYINLGLKDCSNLSSFFEAADVAGCTNLTTIEGSFFNFTNGYINLGKSPLTNKSAMVFINGVGNVSSTKTLTFSSSTFDTLTEEQIALATSKGWSVIRS